MIKRPEVYILGDNMITAFGCSTQEHWDSMLLGQSGLQIHEKTDFLDIPFCASLVEEECLANEFNRLKINKSLTRLEKMFVVSITKAAAKTKVDLKSSSTGFLLSTTKGNIDLLQDKQGFSTNRIRLGKMAQTVTTHFKNPNQPTVISNACISGVMAIIVGARLLRAGHFENIVVTGGDLVTRFTLSGFNALKALSNDFCKPFDANRKGINLGEGVGTMILSKRNDGESGIQIKRGGVSNDANHISGPSRTGEGLQLAIKTALNNDIKESEIDYISAHGTATLYNDEMEAKAFHALNLQGAPLNSFKGYWGHTLGAAGVLESIIACKTLMNNQLLPSVGFEEMGVTMPLNIVQKVEKANLRTVLKTSSGFGGCNAAIVFKKN